MRLLGYLNYDIFIGMEEKIITMKGLCMLVTDEGAGINASMEFLYGRFL